MNGHWRLSAGIVLASAMPAAFQTGCAKKTATGSTETIASASAPAARPAASAPQSSASAKFGGTYAAKTAAIDLAKGDKVVKWPPNPASGALGTGTVDLVVVGPRGDVRGEANGPLGNMVVSGVLDGRDLRANLNPRDPNADNAMTGVIALVADGVGMNATAMRGTLRVSGADARVVREAAVEISRK
jgi:hypothetical protein